MATIDRNGDEGTAPDGLARGYGWMLAAGSVLAVAFAMIHPELSSRDLAGVVRSMADGASFNAAVHGILIGLYLVIVAGYYGFSRRLGLDRPLVALGMTAYSAGALAFTSAAVINGFALASFSSRYVSFRPEQGNAIAAAFNMAGSIAGTWAGIGAAATSGAILAWSLAMFGRGGANRIIGGLGVALGLATIVMLVSGTLILNVHGFLLLVVSQSVWAVAVGVQMIRGRV